jgi:predicted signal transduction protein with EAL and GGDEF domain
VELNQPYQIDVMTVPGSASVGLATATEEESPEDVLARADRQMYDAKIENQQWFALQPIEPSLPRWPRPAPALRDTG